MSDAPEKQEQPEAVCANCPYWRHGDLDAPDSGGCRRHAPRLIAKSDNVGKDWPTTLRGDWCGDHPGRDIALSHSHVSASALQVIAGFIAARNQQERKGPQVLVPNPGYGPPMR